MADISILSRLVNGYQKNVDVSQNSLIVGSIKIGTSSPVEITKTIATNLIALQNGTDFANGTNSHTHDGRYFTETELGSTGATSGADLIGVNNTPTNYSAAAQKVQDHLEGIDAALGAASGTKVKISATDTLSEYLDPSLSVDNGSNATNPLEKSIQNPGSNETLRIRFDQSKVDHGSIAGLGDDDHTIYTKADGTRAFTGNQSFGGFKATNLADPTSAQDAVTKAYLDARENGLKPKQSVRVASSSNIVIASGLEAGDVVDGITLVAGDRVLLYGQTLPEENGIYVAVASGAASRSSDFDELSPIDEINRSWVPVQLGTHAGKVFVQYGTVATLGTDPINFEFYDAIANLVGGDMIAKSGSTLSVDLASTSGLESSNPGNVAGQLRVKLEASNPSLKITGSNELAAKLDPAGALAPGASGIATQVDGSTIEINTNALRVKAAGINENHLNASVAGNGLSGGAGSPLAVNVDDSTIEINSDSLRVKDAGITAAKLNSNVADQSTITGGAGSALAVQQAPKIETAEVAGEALSATTLIALRYAKAADAGFVAGRMYKADIDTSSTENFEVQGLAYPAGAVSTGGAVRIVQMGLINVPSHGFTVGLPIWLDASGAVTQTAPSAVNQAVVRLGMVKDANNINVKIQVMSAG